MTVPVPLQIPLVLGTRVVSPPIVLAPMAGVTNAPFRSLCRSFGPGLVYVNEMVMAAALIHGNAKTKRMVTFSADEDFRSLQIYGSDPDFVAKAVRRLCENDEVDHIDMNFGCPAQKVTRKGGGAAVPVKKNLLRAIMAAAVHEASRFNIPVTCKFRIGINDEITTYIDTGLIAQDEGIAAIALHARTAEQHYAGHARWGAIANLKREVTRIPVLGNGDIWEATDAIEMMRQTQCDGVVIGRGCLGKPWLFRDLVDVFAGREIQPTPHLGFVTDVMLQHADALCIHQGVESGIRSFRKHTGWYLTGYPVGSDIRRRMSMVSSVAELTTLSAELDPTLEIVTGGERIARGHTNGPIRVVLPEGFLDTADDLVPPADAHVTTLSGG